MRVIDTPRLLILQGCVLMYNHIFTLNYSEVWSHYLFRGVKGDTTTTIAPINESPLSWLCWGVVFLLHKTEDHLP